MEPVLNGDARHLVEMIDGLDLKRLEVRYSFMSDQEYVELLMRDSNEAMRVYWTEMLERAHIASITVILRSRQWLAAVLSAQSDRNALMFAGAFRSLLESAADATTALLGIPITLASNYPAISKSLMGRAGTITIAPDLEEELIHYSHGRYIKRSEWNETPQSHRARQSHEYLKVFGDLRADKTAQYYRYLCDLTHPGAPSVSMWFAPADATSMDFILSTEQDEAIINDFLKEYETVPFDTLTFAFNLPVVVLSILNYFPIKNLHTDQLLNWNLNRIPVWTRCRAKLDENGACPLLAERHAAELRVRTRRWHELG